jgi:hypothetical protein
VTAPLTPVYARRLVGFAALAATGTGTASAARITVIKFDELFIECSKVIT